VRSERRSLGSGMVQVVRQRTLKMGLLRPDARPHRTSGTRVNSSHSVSFLAMGTLYSARAPGRAPIAFEPLWLVPLPEVV